LHGFDHGSNRDEPHRKGSRSVEFTSTLSYIFLAVAAVALVVFFVTWSRHSKPTETEPDLHPRHADRDHDARETP
jgi:hypothetical protein